MLPYSTSHVFTVQTGLPLGDDKIPLHSGRKWYTCSSDWCFLLKKIPSMQTCYIVQLCPETFFVRITVAPAWNASPTFNQPAWEKEAVPTWTARHFQMRHKNTCATLKLWYIIRSHNKIELEEMTVLYNPHHSCCCVSFSHFFLSNTGAALLRIIVGSSVPFLTGSHIHGQLIGKLPERVWESRDRKWAVEMWPLGGATRYFWISNGTRSL